MDSIVILGRQPALGLAELESLYGADKVQPLGVGTAALVRVDPCLLAFDRLGGSVKFCRPLTTLDTTHAKQIEKFLQEVSPGHSARMPEGKMHLGLSLLGFPEVSLKRIMSLGLNIKKAINQQTGRTVRLVPNNEPELSSAQVLHNKLTTPNGWELVLIRDGSRTVVAQTVKVQDIASYTTRDRERPKRDAKVGMLPPKLAQIIINLAARQIPEDKLESICDIPAGTPVPPKLLGQTVLDPFCGTGVVLQESLLMGYDAYGTDLEQRMIDYSDANLAWLADKWQLTGDRWRTARGDATSYQWTAPIDMVACETYLGRPFTSRPSPEILTQTVSECNLIIKKFLQNIRGQLKPGTRLCLAVPAWLSTTDGPNVSRLDEVQGAGAARTEPYRRYGEGALQPATQQFAKRRSGVAGYAGKQATPARYVRHLPLVDSLEEIGYNRLSFEHARDEDLVYHRPDQLVARQLLVLQVK